MFEANPIKLLVELVQFRAEHAFPTLIHADQLIKDLKQLLQCQVLIEDEQTEHPPRLHMKLQHYFGAVSVEFEHFDVVVQD